MSASAPDKLEDWAGYATRFLGMQLVDKSAHDALRCAWTTASSA